MSKQLAYHVSNWSDYNQILVDRGRIKLWSNENTVNNWYSVDSGNSSDFSQVYSAAYIQCALRVQAAYELSLGAAQGFMESVV